MTDTNSGEVGASFCTECHKMLTSDEAHYYGNLCESHAGNNVEEDAGGIPFSDIRSYRGITGRTGAYRTRKGWFGKAILQYQWRTLRSDAEGGGHEIGWSDEPYEKAPYVLVFDTPWFMRRKS